MSTRYPMMAIMEESTIPEGVTTAQSYRLLNIRPVCLHPSTYEHLPYLRFSELMNMLIVTYSEAQTSVWSNQTVDTGGKSNLTHTHTHEVWFLVVRTDSKDLKLM